MSLPAESDPNLELQVVSGHFDVVTAFGASMIIILCLADYALA